MAVLKGEHITRGSSVTLIDTVIFLMLISDSFYTFHRKFGCLACSLRFWAKFEQFFINCPALGFFSLLKQLIREQLQAGVGNGLDGRDDYLYFNDTLLKLSTVCLLLYFNLCKSLETGFISFQLARHCIIFPLPSTTNTR